MCRGIINLFWGQKYLNEVLTSIGNSIDTGLPRIAITDHATQALMPARAPFDEVITLRIGERSLLAKADLYTHLPAGYDSFLFLDTDVTIIDDISLGFERAEVHGMAAAMAPHYSLDYFWGFDKILKSLNVPCLGQLQYNTGVIFFKQRPDVEAVMRKWGELALELGKRFAYRNDQPFLTLAMELLGFNPYTLSPAYNYRSLGELVSGTVRMWHSHAPVPEDINILKSSWPPRRFIDGVPVSYRANPGN